MSAEASLSVSWTFAPPSVITNLTLLPEEDSRLVEREGRLRVLLVRSLLVGVNLDEIKGVERAPMAGQHALAVGVPRGRVSRSTAEEAGLFHDRYSTALHEEIELVF